MKSFEPITSKYISDCQDFKNRKHNKFTFKSKLLTLKIYHKIFDYLNLSFICLITIYSFIAFNSQREWTNIYSSMMKVRVINNNLNGYISKTEEYFINEVEMKDQFKKATSKDLIYLKKPSEKTDRKFLFSDLLDGIHDGKYQRGY